MSHLLSIESKEEKKETTETKTNSKNYLFDVELEDFPSEITENELRDCVFTFLIKNGIIFLYMF